MERNNKGMFVSGVNIFEEKDGLIFVYRDNNLLFFTDDVNVKKHTWGKAANGYASAQMNGEMVLAHRFIMGASERFQIVDHKNRNIKDNRIENLRICTKQQNAYNAKVRATNSSGVTGVWYRKDTKKWVAEIKYNGKKKTLGCFESKDEAIKKRREAEKIYCGEFIPMGA